MSPSVSLVSRCTYSAASAPGTVAEAISGCFALVGPDRGFSICSAHAHKVDEAALYIRAHQSHAKPVADVHALKAVIQSSFNGRMQKTYPCAFIGCASNNGIELLADP